MHAIKGKKFSFQIVKDSFEKVCLHT